MALTILIVDDSPLMRRFVARVLANSGLPAEVCEASNGMEALTLLRSTHVDLILTDINMPVMSGEEFVRNLSNDPTLRNIPVIVVSTDGTSFRLERLRALGVKGYIEKPFRPEALREEVLRNIEVQQ